MRHNHHHNHSGDCGGCGCDSCGNCGNCGVCGSCGNYGACGCNNCGPCDEPVVCLGRQCGPSVDTGDVSFTRQETNLVYMDKVFSYNKAKSCPLLFHLDTGNNGSCRYTTDFELDCGCGCGGGQLDRNAVFTIETAYGVLEYIETRPPGNVSAGQVTIDGYEVDSVTYSNGQYTAATGSIISTLQRSRCIDAGLPTKRFLLIDRVCPWEVKIKYVLEGNVSTCGRCCRFKLEIKLEDENCALAIPGNCPSTFSVPDLALPCAVNGIAPDVLFRFGGKVELINPELYISCQRPQRPPMPPDPCEDLPPFLTVALRSRIAVTPEVNVEVVRKSLFCVTACEGLLPCEPEASAAARDNCNCPDPYASPCTCGTAVRGTADACGCGTVAGTSCGTAGNNCCKPVWDWGWNCGNNWNCGCGNGCVGNCGSNHDCNCNRGCGDVCGCNDGCGSNCGDVCGCNDGCGSTGGNVCGCNDGCGSTGGSHWWNHCCGW